MFIDINNWSRKDHFLLFNGFTNPNYSVCANLNISNFISYIKSNDLKFYASIIYLITKTTNEITEFKQRVRGENVFQHRKIHPIYTTLSDDRTFNFCPSTYSEDFLTSYSNTLTAIEKSKQKDYVLENDLTKDDVIYITILPWISFTSINHPYHLEPVNSIPLFTVGKYFDQGNDIMMPFAIQAHHGLVDGLHMGEYFEKLQSFLDSPEIHMYVEQKKVCSA